MITKRTSSRPISELEVDQKMDGKIRSESRSQTKDMQGNYQHFEDGFYSTNSMERQSVSNNLS